MPVSLFLDEKGFGQEYVKGGLLNEDKMSYTIQHFQGNKPRLMASASRMA